MYILLIFRLSASSAPVGLPLAAYATLTRKKTSGLSPNGHYQGGMSEEAGGQEGREKETPRTIAFSRRDQ